MTDTLEDMHNIWRLELRPAGMFSNVNEMVEQLRLAELGGYRFVTNWSRSCYRDPDRPVDPWTYYFEPCFPGLEELDDDLPVLPGGTSVACTRDNIITPRLEDANSNPLLLPKDRQGAHDLINRYLHLRPEVSAIIDSFAETYFTGPVIGLHIRGPGRIDGGALTLRKPHLSDGGVPAELFLRHADAALDKFPGAQIFACSDSSLVIDQVQAEYGDRVVTYDATRSVFGEMHANHPKNAGQVFSLYKLGLDVLVEAWLLARCDFLVHGNSNVANFVLCAAPDLPHDYVPA